MKRTRFTAHDCPVPGCPNTRQHWEAVCKPCWRRLPEYLRAPIEAARRAKAPHKVGAAAVVAIAWLTRAPAAIAARRLGEGDSQMEVG